MIQIRKSEERGHFDHGWLDTYHTFSFGDYYNPQHMGFRSLRVINEDRVEAGQGFGTHPHRDMEIVTYVLEGALAHKDSMGHSEVLRANEVQAMTAGAGITHSEFNHSQSEPVHLLQIWLLPEKKGLKPRYDQRAFNEKMKGGRLLPIVSRDGKGDTITIHQDVRVFASILVSGQKVEHSPAPNRHAWLQVARGAVKLNGQRLSAGDGAAVSDESKLEIAAEKDAEFLLFDLA